VATTLIQKCFHIFFTFLIRHFPIFYPEFYIKAAHCSEPPRVRVGIPHPFMCLQRRLNEAELQMRLKKKPEAPCHSSCGTVKIPPCSKALSDEHRPKICNPSPAMVTSPYKVKNSCAERCQMFEDNNQYMGICQLSPVPFQKFTIVVVVGYFLAYYYIICSRSEH
jgi:hypothetical protein